ncbi:YqhV family protein [Paenibacillus solisilvae]|uniref:YqhV family protein n=1 Tax=Paenibacillus solisilvae TaxID=2486751 RepID=A0ABW0W079_9BACL
MLNKFVMSMASLRVLSGTIEICAALLMLRLNELDRALLINSSLALVGPIILITTTTIGLVGMSDKLSMGKIAWVIGGVACILIGVIKK